MRMTLWIAASLFTLYATLLALAWAFQASLIYPAPRQAVPVPAGFAEVQLRTADGLSLRAFEHRARGGRATIVHFHGNGGSLAGALVETQGLAEAGYGLLLVNYRGYGTNAGRPSEAGFYADGCAAFTHLARRGVMPGETIVMGNSIGSGTATQMALEFAPRALILVSPFTSLTDIAAETLWFLPVRRLLRDRFDSREKIGRLSMPVLIQHGTADTLIPPAHAEALAEAAPDATLQLFDGAGHDLSFQREPQEAQVAWLAELPEVEVSPGKLPADGRARPQ